VRVVVVMREKKKGRSLERVNNGKMNYSAASSSDFHGDKGPENVASRSEGMVESWICSSD
jgi:hypothetical protein